MDGTAQLSRLAPASALLLLLSGVSACGGSDGAPPPNTPATKSGRSDSPQPADQGAAAATPGATSTLAATPAAPAATDAAWPFNAFSTEDRNAQLERLKKDPGPIKSNWVPPGKADRYGHAEGLISAAPDTVRARLIDFNRYRELAGPKFKTVQVVDKQGQNTDVYFLLPIMKGMITISYTTRFAPPRAAAGGDVIEGTFVKGKIKGMHIAFTLRPGTEEKNSVLVCDLLLQPNVPAPQSALDEELRDACGDAINSLRKTIAANP